MSSLDSAQHVSERMALRKKHQPPEPLSEVQVVHSVREKEKKKFEAHYCNTVCVHTNGGLVFLRLQHKDEYWDFGVNLFRGACKNTSLYKLPRPYIVARSSWP